MLQQKKRKRLNKKLVISAISVLSVLLFVLCLGVINVLGSQTQTVMSGIAISYQSNEVDGNMRLRAYYKAPSDSQAGWHTLTTSTVNGELVNYIELSTNDSSNGTIDNIGNLIFDEDNDYIVFECAFENTSSKMVKMTFTDSSTNMTNITKTQLISRSALSSSDFDTIVDSPSAYSSLAVTGKRDLSNYIEGYVYYYVKLNVTKSGNDSRYTASHTWSFSTNYSSSDVVTVSVNNDGGTGGISSVKGLTGACLPVLPTGFEPTKTKPSGYTGNYGIYGYYSTTTNDEQYYRSTGEPTRALTTLTNNTVYAQYAIEAYVDSSTLEASWPSGLSKSTQVRVIIPSTATSVKSSGFSSCSGLIGVDIPNTIIEMKNSAFSGCTLISKINIPNSVEIIGPYAFNYCSNLNYNIDGNLKYLGNDTNSYLVLMGGTSADISTVDINNNTKIIYYQAFYNNTTLTDITIPNSITSIGSSAFYGCTSMSCDLTSLTLSSVDISAFYNCTGLTGTVTLTGTIENHAFNNCTGLTGVTIGENVTSIGGFAFYNCTGLTGVTMGENVTSIGSSAFSGCTNMSCDLTSLTLSSVGGHAFSGCAGLTGTVTLTGTIGNCAFYGCTGLTGVTMGEDVTSIGYNAFDGCTNMSCDLTSLTLSSVGYSAFYNCTGLTGTVTLTGTIGTNAFSNCTGLTGVVIGNSVTSIGGSAFNTCSALTTVKIDSQTIVNNLTSQTSCEYLIQYATAIYIKDDLTATSYITTNYPNVTNANGYKIYSK